MKKCKIQSGKMLLYKVGKCCYTKWEKEVKRKSGAVGICVQISHTVNFFTVDS